MQDRQLLRIAIISSIIGIIALFMITQITEIDSSSIQSVKLCGKTDVSIKGVVTGTKKIGDMTIITVSQEENIEVIAYENQPAEVGDEITVQGKVGQYKGQNQIVADKIKIW